MVESVGAAFLLLGGVLQHPGLLGHGPGRQVGELLVIVGATTLLIWILSKRGVPVLLEEAAEIKGSHVTVCACSFKTTQVGMASLSMNLLLDARGLSPHPALLLHVRILLPAEFGRVAPHATPMASTWVSACSFSVALGRAFAA